MALMERTVSALKVKISDNSGSGSKALIGVIIWALLVKAVLVFVLALMGRLGHVTAASPVCP
jgi:uncharacterized membrane protein